MPLSLRPPDSRLTRAGLVPLRLCRAPLQEQRRGGTCPGFGRSCNLTAGDGGGCPAGSFVNGGYLTGACLNVSRHSEPRSDVPAAANLLEGKNAGNGQGYCEVSPCHHKDSTPAVSAAAPLPSARSVHPVWAGCAPWRFISPPFSSFFAAQRVVSGRPSRGRDDLRGTYAISASKFHTTAPCPATPSTYRAHTSNIILFRPLAGPELGEHNVVVASQHQIPERHQRER